MPIPFQLPNTFIKSIQNTYGDEGTAWIEALPRLLRFTSEKFNITIKRVLSALSFNLIVEAAQSNGSHIIVKLCPPTREVAYEIHALKCMKGCGVVSLIDADQENGILLLEMLVPGAVLSTLTDDRTMTVVAAEIMQKIARPISSNELFPTTQQWFDRLNQPVDTDDRLLLSLVDRAKKIATELHHAMGEPVLLHGDLHHANILSAEREPWLAIDPKGVIGEREYEVGAFMRNPIAKITGTSMEKVLVRRLDHLCDFLDFDRNKVIAWSFAQAVLAAVWSIDDKHDSWRLFSQCANALNNIS